MGVTILAFVSTSLVQREKPTVNGWDGQDSSRLTSHGNISATRDSALKQRTVLPESSALPSPFDSPT